jgi:hypothetical protein
VLAKPATVASPQPSLAGKRVFLEPLVDQSNVAVDWKDSQPAAIEYTYIAPTATAQGQWQQEMAKAKGTAADALYRLGWQRNLYGMPVRDVLSTTQPAPWLSEAITAELLAQGVTLAADAQQADLVVRGALRFIRVELSNTKDLLCDLVVDLRFERPGQPAPKAEEPPVRLHTRGAVKAWSGSAAESLEAVLRAEQQLQQLLVTRVAEEIARTPSCPCPTVEAAPPASEPAAATAEPAAAPVAEGEAAVTTGETPVQ